MADSFDFSAGSPGLRMVWPGREITHPYVADTNVKLVCMRMDWFGGKSGYLVRPT